jgi:hypothetical protein
VFQLGLVNQAAWNPTMRTLTSHHDFRTVWYVRSIVASLLGKRLSCHSFVWDEIWRREQLEHLTRPRLSHSSLVLVALFPRAILFVAPSSKVTEKVNETIFFLSRFSLFIDIPDIC